MRPLVLLLVYVGQALAYSARTQQKWRCHFPARRAISALRAVYKQNTQPVVKADGILTKSAILALISIYKAWGIIPDDYI